MNKLKAKGLEVKWHTPTDAFVAAPVVVNKGVAFVATTNFGIGSLYAMNADDGTILWQNTYPGGFLASPLADGKFVYAATRLGVLYKLDRDTGATIWSFQPSLSTVDTVWTGPIKVFNGEKDIIILAINPDDEGLQFPGGPNVPDIGVAGIIAVDDDTGLEEWRFLTTKPGEGGAGVWELSPSFSKKLNLIYISTGQTAKTINPTPPFGSNAVFAIDALTGQQVWKNQVRNDDIWNFAVPFDPTAPLDTDIGDGVAVFKMQGKEFVAVGSKRGYFYVMDAATGTIINGSGTDALGFKKALDAYNGGTPSGVIGLSTDGGYNLDAGYYKKGNEIIHFAILNDYTSGMEDVAAQVPPFDGSGTPSPGHVPGTCFISNMGLSPGCPPKDSGNLILINGDGSAELGRFVNPGGALFSPVYLDDMIFVHATPDSSHPNNRLLVIDVSDPTNPTLLESVDLVLGAAAASSLGASPSIGNGMIYTGNGFLGFGPQQGVFAIGLKK